MDPLDHTTYPGSNLPMPLDTTRIVLAYATARNHGLISPKQKPQAYLLSFILSHQYASNLSHQYPQPAWL